ncbi:MAG TPA: RNA-binding domain-containing protein [Ignavibacteria bacterium]
MALPINIEELINGRTVESERIEFREGWNPERTLRTICAFANDFNNWGGGYVIIGIAEQDGQPVLPPKGLELNQIEPIQRELNTICRRILPNYFPIAEPVDFQNKKILILWCPGGSNRPYKAPDTLGNTPRYFYYIRRFSLTVQPNLEEERELLSMANQIPFDDRINHNTNLDDFDINTIKTFLKDVKSELEGQIGNLSIGDIARRMNIAEGPNENLIPKNVGILFFAKNTQQFFPGAKIEVINFKDESGTEYTEKIFEGNIQNQLRDALSYIKSSVISEKIKKIEGKAESDRFFNYPYEAIEESLCNAVYHRGYDNDSTIEFRIYPERIDILSYPGPLPPLDNQRLQNFQLDVRKYRNRRIGEFLKELHLTEGRATGVPSILKSLEKNGSPKPILETDNDRTYFKTTLKIHSSFSVGGQGKEQAWEQVSVQVSEQANLAIINNIDEILKAYEEFGEQVSEQVREQVKNKVNINKLDNLIKILTYSQNEHIKEDILANIGLGKSYLNYKRYVFPLVNQDLLCLTIPDKPKSPNQKYKTTEKGLKLLEILS